MLTKNYRSLVPAVTEKLSVRFSPNLLRQSGYSCHLNAAFSWCAVSAREGSPRGYTAASISCREEGKKTRKFESVSLERTEGRGWGWSWGWWVFTQRAACFSVFVSVFDCGDANSRCAPALWREHPPTEPAGCGVIPASTDFTPNEGSRVTGFYRWWRKSAERVRAAWAWFIQQYAHKAPKLGDFSFVSSAPLAHLLWNITLIWDDKFSTCDSDVSHWMSPTDIRCPVCSRCCELVKMRVTHAVRP